MPFFSQWIILGAQEVMDPGGADTNPIHHSHAPTSSYTCPAIQSPQPPLSQEILRVIELYFITINSFFLCHAKPTQFLPAWQLYLKTLPTTPCPNSSHSSSVTSPRSSGLTRGAERTQSSGSCGCNWTKTDPKKAKRAGKWLCSQAAERAERACGGHGKPCAAGKGKEVKLLRLPGLLDGVVVVQVVVPDGVRGIPVG